MNPAAAAAAPPAPPRGALAKIDPRYLQAGLATTILVTGQLLYQSVGGMERLFLSIATGLLADTILSTLLRGRWPAWPSVYISSLSVVILTKPAAVLWPFILTPLISITSKYSIAYRGRHLFNPTNFGMCVLLLVAPDQIALLSTQWGNSREVLLLLWAWGLLVVWRARVMEVTLTYAAASLFFAWVRTLVSGDTFAAEIGPMTGPMQTLFMFFMITDPATVVRQKKDRVVVVLLISALECFFRLQNVWSFHGLDWVLRAPSMFALFFVGPVAKLIDLRREARLAG